MKESGGPSLLAVIPQCPLDPASGAARSMRGVCELLAQNGWDVSFAATTGTESGHNFDADTLRHDYGIAPFTHPPDRSRGRKYLTFSHRGVSYLLLDTEGYSVNEARAALPADMDALVLQATERAPDVLLTYGSSQEEVRRRAALRAQGVRVVFFLRNFSYFHDRSFTEVDAVVTPSQFLSDHYQDNFGLCSTPLPLCLDLDEVVAPCREPVFNTFINPCPGKGLDIFLPVLRTATRKRPDIPFLVVESRASGELLVSDEAWGANLYIARNTPQPRHIYAVTRVLLVPSTAPEGGPRVIAEAQLNGIPIVASDRCALARTPEFGGFIRPVTPAAVDSWFEVLCRLHDDETLYSSASRLSYLAADQYRTGDAARANIEFFREIVCSPKRA